MSATDRGHFRHVLGHVPTAVTIVTATGPAGPAGLVVGSFVSISLEPQLVGMFVTTTSTSWPAVESAGSFVVNVLAGDQNELCARFARSGVDKFAGLNHALSPKGHPVLDECLAWLECDLHRVELVGDHFFVVGATSQLQVCRDATPLVFFRGGLTELPGAA